MTVNDEDTIRALVELGLSEQKAKETLKNAAVTKTLKAILHEVNFQVCLKIVFLWLFLADTWGGFAGRRRDFVVPPCH